MEAIVFGDAEALVIGFFEAELPDHGFDGPVVGNVPDPRPSQFVRVLCTGGVENTIVSEWVRITTEVWAPDAITAHDLAQICRALLKSLRGTVQAGIPVYRVNEVSRPQQQPDPMSGTPRSVFTVELHVRGQLLTTGS